MHGNMASNRKKYGVGFLLVLTIWLGLVVYCVQQTAQHRPTAQDEWNKLSAWLGPAAEDVSMTPRLNAQGEEVGQVYRWRNGARSARVLAEELKLPPAEPHCAPEVAPNASQAWRAQHEQVFLTTDGDSFYRIRELWLTHTEDGLNTMIICVDSSENGYMEGATHALLPLHEATPVPNLPRSCQMIWLSIAAAPLWVPLGVLLMLPGFNFSKRRHYAWWYGCAVSLPAVVVYFLAQLLPSGQAHMLGVLFCIVLLPLILGISTVLMLILRAFWRAKK
jgi:hypothetical protein